jgi:hypothetical protein
VGKLTTSGTAGGVRLDAAIEQALGASSVDGVTRVSLTELQGALSGGRGRRGEEPAAPENLQERLMSFVMPRLRHPEVLQAERHRSLLERLVADLSEGSDGRVVREGALELRRELKRLEFLRQQRNSLVEV